MSTLVRDDRRVDPLHDFDETPFDIEIAMGSGGEEEGGAEDMANHSSSSAFAPPGAMAYKGGRGGRRGEEESGALLLEDGTTPSHRYQLSALSVQPFTPCCDRVGKQILICGPSNYQAKSFPSICLVGPDWPCLM